jgi:hypothetical protein
VTGGTPGKGTPNQVLLQTVGRDAISRLQSLSNPAAADLNRSAALAVMPS